MTRCDWLATVPEEARRALYVQALDSGGAITAVSWQRELRSPAERTELINGVQQLPGLKWSSLGPNEAVLATEPPGRHLEVRALCLTSSATVAAPPPGEGEGQGHKVEALSPRQLCLPAGAPGGPALDEFVERAAALVAQRDGLGLWRATHEEIGRVEATLHHASTLRWLLTALEVAKPDQALVLSLLKCLRLGEYVAPPEDQPVTHQAGPTPAGGGRADGAVSIEQAFQILQSQLTMLSVPCAPGVVDGRLLAASTVLSRVLAVTGLERYLGATEEATRQALMDKSAEPLRSILADVLQIWMAELNVTPDVMLEAPIQPVEPSPRPEAAKPEEVQKQAIKVLKVEPARIEVLMKLVGELVVAKNSLPFLAKRAEDEFGASQLARAIGDQYAVVNRITEELQGAVMRVRMVPMSAVFRRFPRLVRDLSGKLSKKIRLDLLGEETEADKDVVEDLFEPLMHLMRNSIDHGLEGPEERERAGKSPEGTIRLCAIQQEDQVVIEIGDDGRGIDTQAIKDKAIDRGFVAAADVARMSDEEALQLVFLAGLSTAQQVTDLSGRGVGMDVVRAMVSRVGGAITLHSTPGQGTKTVITLPLTMAVSHVMVVEVGGIAFGIPFSCIVETARIPTEQIRRIQHGEALVLRGRIVPLFRLSRVLQLGERRRTNDTEALVVARVGDDLVAFVIDEFHEAVDILMRPMEGVLKGLELFSGTALLGDGRPLLIIDVKALVESVGRGDARTALGGSGPGSSSSLHAQRLTAGDDVEHSLVDGALA